jgi:glycosyltransferase involved in cell wall biosynthesis
MGYGNCVLTLATPENIEAVGDAGIPYDNEFDLAEKLQRVLRDGSLVQSYRNRAQARVQRYYDWDRVVDQYERLFAEMSGKTEGIHSAVAATQTVSQEEKVLSRK